jgi:hypothetical protein
MIELSVPWNIWIYIYINTSLIIQLNWSLKIWILKLNRTIFWGSIRTAFPWWPLGNSKWFSNYNLDNCVEIDLAETKIEHFHFDGNDTWRKRKSSFLAKTTDALLNVSHNTNLQISLCLRSKKRVCTSIFYARIYRKISI